MHIRFAQRDDVAIVYSFIKKLAEFEKLSHEVTATPEQLEKNLFEHRYAEILLAEENGTAVGFALFFHNFSTFWAQPSIYLEDLFVDPEYRGRGYGKALMYYLARLARQRGCARVEWSVLDWNEKAKAFYESIGARPMDDWTTYRLSGKALTLLGAS